MTPELRRVLEATATLDIDAVNRRLTFRHLQATPTMRAAKMRALARHVHPEPSREPSRGAFEDPSPLIVWTARDDPRRKPRMRPDWQTLREFAVPADHDPWRDGCGMCRLLHLADCRCRACDVERRVPW